MNILYSPLEENGQLSYLPLIDITLFGDYSALQTLALIDSGAEHNVFSYDIANQLGISLEESEPVTIFGIGNVDYTARLSSVRLQFGRHQWTAPALFADVFDQYAILGHAGFFAFFNVAFRYKKREIQITSAR